MSPENTKSAQTLGGCGFTQDPTGDPRVLPWLLAGGISAPSSVPQSGRSTSVFKVWPLGPRNWGPLTYCWTGPLRPLLRRWWQHRLRSRIASGDAVDDDDDAGLFQLRRVLWPAIDCNERLPRHRTDWSQVLLQEHHFLLLRQTINQSQRKQPLYRASDWLPYASVFVIVIKKLHLVLRIKFEIEVKCM